MPVLENVVQKRFIRRIHSWKKFDLKQELLGFILLYEFNIHTNFLERRFIFSAFALIGVFEPKWKFRRNAYVHTKKLQWRKVW